MRARLARLLRRREKVPAATTDRPAPLAPAAREARVAAARARAWAGRLAERAQQDRARVAIVAALLATEQAAARHAARAGAGGRSDGRPPLLH